MIFIKIEVRLQRPLDSSMWGRYRKQHICTEAPEGMYGPRATQQGRTAEWQGFQFLSLCSRSSQTPQESPLSKKKNQRAEPRI